ncbi:MAG TPA: hypothetical protein VG897_04015 [Terriglobales bacterium]|nr:hypothetical protein [Terriglobales bacterium]
MDRWTRSPDCANRFEDWNQIAELAICCEPTAYQAVFYEERFSGLEAYDSIRQGRRDFQNTLDAFLTETPLGEIHNAREELCCDAQIIDDNKLLHVLLRLMSSHERQKVKGQIGAALLFLSMAEMIRREAETATSSQLPEEDEIGFGEWMVGARKSIFGSERFLDSAPETRRNFLTTMGLDFGVKVRCYVEGETELGALESAVGSGYGIQFVNLRGAFAEGSGRGLSFADSLQNDLKSKIFSVIAFDGDRLDNLRLVRKAAADGAFFGRFFIAQPDFEFENFVLDELIDVTMTLVNQEFDSDSGFRREDVRKAVAGASSGKEFFQRLRAIGITRVDKGRIWGRNLVGQAVRRPRIPDGRNEDRQVIQIARLLLHARQSGFDRSFDKLRVDPSSGELVPRQGR